MKIIHDPPYNAVKFSKGNLKTKLWDFELSTPNTLLFGNSILKIAKPDHLRHFTNCELQDPDAHIFISMITSQGIIYDRENRPSDGYIMSDGNSAYRHYENAYHPTNKVSLIEGSISKQDIKDACDIADEVIEFLIDKNIL